MVTNRDQQRAGTRSSKQAGRGGDVGGGNTAALHRGAAAAENAQSNVPQQTPAVAGKHKSSSRPQSSPLAFDALLLSSFHSTVAAAADCDGSWLSDMHTPNGGEEEGVEVSPLTARLPSPGRHQTISSAAAAGSGGPGSPTSLLLLPHLHSAGSEGTSWLVSSSPLSSPHSSPSRASSSPSMATSRSISLTGPCFPSASASAVGSAAPPSAALGARHGGALDAEPYSPITLQPLPRDRRHGSGLAPLLPLGASPGSSAGAWWTGGSPAHSAGSTPPAAAPLAAAGGGSQQASPLAARLTAALPPGRGSPGGSSPPQQQWRSEPAAGVLRQRRLHSSPFLSRDCSSVDVFCPDRYSSWTQRQRYAASLDDAEAGIGGMEGGGRQGLRRVLAAALGWVSGRLVSHPLEWTPSDLASYGSCSSGTLPGTPSSSSSPGPLAPRFFTPASGNSSSSAHMPGSCGGSGGSRSGALRTLSGSLAAPAAAPHMAATPVAVAAAVPRLLRYSPAACGSAAETALSTPPRDCAASGRCELAVLAAHLEHEHKDWHLAPQPARSPGEEQFHSPMCCSSPPH